MTCHEIEADNMPLRELFAGHLDLRAVIDAVLEGVLGRVFVDAPDRPSSARLSVGVYEVLGGDPERGADLIADVPRPCEILVPREDPGWLVRAQQHFGSHLSERAMRTFDFEGMDPAGLSEMASALPERYRIEAVTEELATRIGPGLGPNRIENFGSAARFIERGFGCCALLGEEIACAATTYALSSRGAEIAIATDSTHRRRGLAVAVGAEMVRMCLERSCLPVWTAANEPSTRVARKLGFRASGWCLTHDLTAGDV